MPEEEKPEPQYRTLWVRSTDPSVCGVWDKHPQQPDGEVFVSGTEARQVAATPVVLDALAKGRLVEVSGPAGREKPEAERPLPSEGSPAQPAIGGESPSDAAEKRRR